MIAIHFRWNVHASSPRVGGERAEKLEFGFCIAGKFVERAHVR